MSQTKRNAFPENEVRLATFAKALAHPARIAILKTLAKRNACICGEIVDVMPLAQSTVSQHLKALKHAGLITGTIDGPRSCYCINADGLAALNALLSAFFVETAPTSTRASTFPPTPTEEQRRTHGIPG